MPRSRSGPRPIPCSSSISAPACTAARSASYRLAFDIVDAGGAATRDVRIGSSLVSFPVWAFATDSTPGSTVRVVFPAGYEVQVESGSIPDPTKDASGRVIFQTAKLGAPLSFFAYLVADRPAAHADQVLTANVGEVPVALTIRSWADDTAWSKRVGGLVVKALPLLADRIGLPWPRDGGLVIHEAVSRSTGGYAGLFDPSGGQIEVAYYADDGVVLHEIGARLVQRGLLADRWANEAFASYYGLEVADALKVKAAGEVLTPALEAARIPLNAWGPVGREDANDRGRTPTRPRWPSRAPSPSGPARTACARCGPTRRATSARTSRRCPRTVPRRRSAAARARPRR